MKKKVICAYVLKEPLLGKPAGEVVHMEQETAKPLVASGMMEEATNDDMNGPEEADEAPEDDTAVENAAVQRAVASLTRNIEAQVTKATADQARKHAVAPRVPAQVKEPIFRSTGEMLVAQYKAATQRCTKSLNRLNAYEEDIRLKAPLGSNEGNQGQGGYSVKPEWYKEIWDKVREYPKLLEKTERISINSNTLNIPALSETSLADGSRHGGILSYWVSEGSVATSSFPSLTQVQAVLNTQVVLIYVTNQLLQDSNIESFDTFINKKVALEFIWQEDFSVISGSGSSQPTGVLNQPALVTVVKDPTNSVAAAFQFSDLANMYRSLYPPSRANAVWLMNPEAYSILIRQVFITAGGTATTYPAFGGVSYNAAEEFPLRIFGKPVIETMMSPQLGAVGDIILCDLSQLITAEHPGIEAAISTEIQFTSLQTAFRFCRRFDIKSPWTGALASVDGHYSYSPFVVLGGRGT